jgi:CRISPR-associated endonuclease/helicase Cas3
LLRCRRWSFPQGFERRPASCLDRPLASCVFDCEIVTEARPAPVEQLDPLIGNLLAFWGKARPAQGGAVPFHPALLHCLDVAAVAAVLCEDGLAAGMPELLPALPFLAGLHDIGKFSRGFQQQCPEHWPAAAFGAFGRISTERHDTTGYWLVRAHCLDLLRPVFPRTSDDTLLAILRAVTGHHGRPPQEGDALDPDDPYPRGICPASAAAARKVIGVLHALLAPAPIAPVSRKRAASLSWRLAGLVNLADWLGSVELFPYVQLSSACDLPGYISAHAMPRARQAVAGAGLRPAAARDFSGLRGLFPAIPAASPVQAWAEQADLPDGPLLALIEDVTGSGKTEAAMVLAHRLLAQGRADGVFVGLPTMATAGAMFARLQDSYRGLFAAGAAPSLALAHGRARLDARFTATILDGQMDGDISDGAASASSQCAAWLADGGRRALLAQLGVGTLDQALLSVLPARYAALRQFGLSRKVLIIDEVHAYDHYMRAELAALLRCHADAGGSAILLSATLTRELRENLLNAFVGGLGGGTVTAVATAYPLVSLATSDGVREQPCCMRKGLARRVAIRRVGDIAAAVAAIADAAARGAAVAWVRNTVDDAIAGWQALAAEGIGATLFHARFAMTDRLSIEQSVLARFGKASVERAGVVVATQVIEQSLDLDFDLIVTDMAPADLLIQRAGRLWRHARPPEQRPLAKPELLILGPEPVDAPGADWLSASLPGTAWIYPAALVWRSARAMLAAGAIETPGNVRALVEAAYDESAPMPDGLARSETKSIAEAHVTRSLAQMNLLRMEKGYCAAAGAWDSETRTPTRLEDGPTVTLRLAVVSDGQVVPYAANAPPELAWALSEVRVSAARAADAPVPAHLRAAAEQARAGWGRWEREASDIKLVVLQPGDGLWRAELTDGKGRPFGASYNETGGLNWR